MPHKCPVFSLEMSFENEYWKTLLEVSRYANEKDIKDMANTSLDLLFFKD